MPQLRNNGDGSRTPGVSDETVYKVGRAVGRIALIREAYREGQAGLESDSEKRELTERADAAAIQAISEQGLSVTEYNRVVEAADDDPVLEDRLIAAAQAD